MSTYVEEYSELSKILSTIQSVKFAYKKGNTFAEVEIPKGIVHLCFPSLSDDISRKCDVRIVPSDKLVVLMEENNLSFHADTPVADTRKHSALFIKGIGGHPRQRATLEQRDSTYNYVGYKEKPYIRIPARSFGHGVEARIYLQSD